MSWVENPQMAYTGKLASTRVQSCTLARFLTDNLFTMSCHSNHAKVSSICAIQKAFAVVFFRVRLPELRIIFMSRRCQCLLSIFKHCESKIIWQTDTSGLNCNVVSKLACDEPFLLFFFLCVSYSRKKYQHSTSLCAECISEIMRANLLPPPTYFWTSLIFG